MICPFCSKQIDPYRSPFIDEIPKPKEVIKPKWSFKNKINKQKLITIGIWIMESLTKLINAIQVLAIILAVIGAVYGLIVYPIYKNIQSDGKTSYCYIEFSNPTGSVSGYYLYGDVPWGENRSLGKYDTLETAKKAAESLNCPIK